MPRPIKNRYYRSIKTHIAALLERYLRNNSLPDAWGGRESTRHRKAYFCALLASDPERLRLPPGIRTGNVDVWVNLNVHIRFAEIFGEAPDFTLNLMLYIRENVLNPSWRDRIKILLRLGFEDRLAMLDANEQQVQFADELARLVRKHGLGFAVEVLQEYGNKDAQPILEPKADDTAYALSQLLGKRITGANVQKIRGEVKKEDRLQSRHW